MPAPLSDTEMEVMRSGLSTCLGAEPHPFLTVGRRVRITAGPFAGLEGVLTRKEEQFYESWCQSILFSARLPLRLRRRS